MRWRKLTGPARTLNLPTGPDGDARENPDGGLPPIVAAGPNYEDDPGDHRAWVSFRDPFYTRVGDRGLLLMAARTPHGPAIRRGCVGAALEVAPHEFELLPPLHHPGQYEDVEVPNLFQLDDRWFLVGSIREDAKIRYWYRDGVEGPWRNYFDNVLLASGNYAGRISEDDRGLLVWNFYTPNALLRSRHNMMPPPKRLERRSDGRLGITTFEAFDQRVEHRIPFDDLAPLEPIREDRDECTSCVAENGSMELTSRGGFHGFLMSPEMDCFRLRVQLRFEGDGKCGLLFRFDPTPSDGYFLSLDMVKGIAQLRAWGRQEGALDQAFRFEPLQSAFWRPGDESVWDLQLLAFGGYIEFSIDDHVLLSLVDQTYPRGRIGFYVESATIRVEHPVLEKLRSPTSPSESLHSD